MKVIRDEWRAIILIILPHGINRFGFFRMSAYFLRIRSLFFFLFSLIIFPLEAQDKGEIKFDLKSTGFSLKNLQTSWRPENKKKDLHSLEIQEFSLNFSDLQIKSLYHQNKFVSNMTLKGPNLSIKGFSLYSTVFSENWITKERLNNLYKKELIPRKSLEEIAKSINLFLIDEDSLPRSLNELSIKNYLNLDESPFNDFSWNYILELPNQIIAKPTQINKDPKTNIIIYNFANKDFQLSPTLDSLNNTPNIQWNYNFDVQEISQLFSSSMDIILEPVKKEIDLEINRSKFKIENLNFTATPGSQFENQIKINLPELILEVNDLVLQGDFLETPLIHNIKGTFKLRNFEIKFPKDLMKQQKLEDLLKTLGIWNNAIKIRLIEIDFNLINELTGNVNIKIQTPFLKVLVDAHMSIRQNGTVNPEIIFHSTEVKISPIALGVRKYIKSWEKKNGKRLNREGSTIILKVQGPLKNLLIQGF